MRRLWAVAALAFAIVPGPCAGETLRDTLREHSVPLAGRLASELDRRITSYAVLDSPADFAIAYYVNDGSGLLRPPLLVLHYERVPQRWHSTAIRKVSILPRPGLDGLCLGSALRIERQGGFWFVDTHINPSAGCLLVLSPRLELKKALYGWAVGWFRSGRVIMHHSEVHFAPTHPMELSIYDPRTGALTKIYPPQRDPLRAEFAGRIAAVLDENWCREHNHHCDPRLFDSDCRELVVSDRSQAFAFAAYFDASSYGPKADETIGTLDVVYVYRLGPHGIEHRAFEVSEDEGRNAKQMLQKLVEPQSLRQLFGSR